MREEMKASEMTGKKAAKCVAPQLLSLSGSLNVSFIQAQSKTSVLVVIENRIGQPNAEMHVTHTQYGFTAFLASQRGLKRHSHTLQVTM